MTNSANFLDLNSKINIRTDESSKYADDRTRSVTLSELYHDVKNYVEANLDLKLQVVNVPTTNQHVKLSVLSDFRTLKLDVPSSNITVDDIDVKITSDEILNPVDQDGLGIANQKVYNEYSLERIKWLVAWSERADKQAIYSDSVNDDPITDISTRLENWRVTAELDHTNKGVLNPAINKLDGEWLRSLITDLDGDIDEIRYFIQSLYQANQFNKYQIKINTGNDIPEAGELLYKPVDYSAQDEILISELSYAYNAETTGDGDPDVPNNYLIYNLKESVKFSIDGNVFDLDYDISNPENAIERVPADSTTGTAAYYKVKVATFNALGAPTASGDDVRPVAMYRMTSDVTDLLNLYMKKDGLKSTTSDQDAFTGKINFEGGLHLKGDVSPIELEDSTGAEGNVLISQGIGKTPKWEDIDNFDIFVKKAGDNMTGALVMENADINFRIPGESLKDANGDPVLDSEGKEKWDTSIERFSRIKSLAPRILRSDGTYGADTSAQFGIKVDIGEGSTYKNRFQVSNRNGDIVTITGGIGAQIEFASSGFTPNYPNTGLTSGIPIRYIPTPNFEDSPGDLAVNKEYVDERDQLILDQLSSGDCVNIGDGHLCAGAPHPKFIATLNDPDLVKAYQLDNNSGITIGSEWVHTGNDDAKNLIYRATYSAGNRTKIIYKTNYVTLTQEKVGQIYSSMFNGSEANIDKGTMSHDQKYAFHGVNYKDPNTSGTNGSHYNRDNVAVLSSLGDSDTALSYDVYVASGRTGKYYPISMVSTGAKPDSDSGYMIGSFYSQGQYNHNTVYNNSLVVYNYSKTSSRNYPDKTFNLQNLFGAAYSGAYISKGNPKYDEIFVCTNLSNKQSVYKVEFGDTVNDTELVELLPKASLSGTVQGISYLPKSKRYFIHERYKAYLTRPYNGPLDDTWQLNAIELEIPDYELEMPWNTYRYSRYSHYSKPFEFGNEIVYMGSYFSNATATNPDDSTDRRPFVIPQAVMIYEGGTEFIKYESTVLDGQDDDWVGDFDYERKILHTFFDKYKMDDISQQYGTYSVRTAYDVEFLTPGFYQPYTQPLLWNNETVKIEETGDITDNVDLTRELVSATYGIDGNYNLKGAETSTAYDGFVYRISDGGQLTSSSYKQIWFTNGWINDRFKELGINNAIDAKVANLTGTLAPPVLGDVVNFNKPVPFSRSNVDGFLVQLSSTVRYDQTTWKFVMPSVFQVLLPYSDVEPLLQIDLS